MSAKMDAKKRRLSTILINAASVLEKCEEQILPALYSRVGASFQATPTQLGNITLARSFMQALASPIAGVASHFMPRGRVIALGCFVWSTFTVLFASTSSLAVALPLVAMNGIGLALVIPSVQSLTADYNAAEARGKAFGALWLTISFGGMLGALYATNVGGTSPLGLDGWRFVFYSVAAVSVGVGLLNAAYVTDPGYPAHQQQYTAVATGAPGSDAWRSSGGAGVGNNGPGGWESGSPRLRPSSPAAVGAVAALGSSNGSAGAGPPPPRLDMAMLRSTAADIASVMRIPTFALIILQGIVGSVPYASLVFLTLYLQLIGMSDAAASGLVATYLICGGLGGLLGGAIGDAVAARWPNHGRVVATQFSVAAGIPFATLIFKGLPLNGDPATVSLYAAVIAAFALATAWPAPCANNPIFAEIVPPRLRNLVYAFDRCFEGAVAAFSTPFVGYLSEKYFGFSGTSTVSGDAAVDVANAKALGSALLVFSVVPWTFCLATYSGLHWTYPKDKRRAAAAERDGKLTSAGSVEAVGWAEGPGSGSGSGRASSVSLRQGGGGVYGEERTPLTTGQRASV